MTSWDAAITAMEAVNTQLETHFEHLSDPHFLGNTREHIGRYAAEGVARGFYAIALHQQLLSWQLDDLVLEQLQAGESRTHAEGPITKLNPET